MIERFGSLAWRLRLYLITGAVVVFTLVTLCSFFAARYMLKEENEAQTRYMAKSTATQIETLFSQIKGVTDGMSRHMESDPPESLGEIRQMLTVCLQSHDYIHGTCVAYAPDIETSVTSEARAPFLRRDDGNTFAYSDLSTPTLWYTEDWFYLPHEMQKPVWSEPYSDPDSGNMMMVTYSSPFFWDIDGKRTFAGVVIVDISLNWVQDVISNLPLEEDDFAFLISGQGTFIAHPESDLVMNQTIFSLAEQFHDKNVRGIGRSMIAGFDDLVQYKSYYRDKYSWLAFSPIASTQWSLGIFVSQSRMNALLGFHTALMIQLGILGILGLLLVIQIIARSITKPLMELQQKARVLATGNLDTPIVISTKYQDEVASLGDSFETMRVDLKKYMTELRQTVSRKERIESELRIARDIQMGLVPKTFPAFPMRHDMDLFASMVPAYDVGGDFYDFFLIDEHHLLLSIADVSGKGVPAALFMAVTRSFLRSIFRSETSISDAIGHINNELARDNDSCMFVTLICAIADLETGELTFVNAGHNLPYLITGEGQVKTLTEQHGPPLGMLEDAQYTQSTIQLSPRDMLFFYTDGVNEAMDAEQNQFGDDRVENTLEETAALECQEATQEMLHKIHTFTKGAEQSDDITLMFWRWLVSGRK